MERRSARVGAALLAAALVTGCGDDDPVVPNPAPPPIAAGAGSAAPLDAATVSRLLASMNRGLSHLERYDYGSSMAEFRAATVTAPGFYPGWFNLGVSLANLQKHPEEAEAALRRAMALEPLEAAPHFMLGMHFLHGVSPPRSAEALQAFATAARLAPRDADSHLRHGLLMKETGDMEGAEAAFTRALTLNPHLGVALYQRGQNRLRLGREDDGMADLERFRVMEQADRTDERDISYGFMGSLGAAITDLERWLPPAPPVESAPVLFTEATGTLDDATDPGGAMALADLDGDGLFDLVAASAQGAFWSRNLGAWKFGPRHPLPAPVAVEGLRPGDMAVADLDSDGALDVVLGGWGIVYAAGGESVRAVAHPAPAAAGRTFVADLDADGDLDIVAGRTVLLGDGRGAFTAAVDVSLPPANWEPLTLLDIDDDGFPDLVGAATWVRNLRGGAFGGEEPLVGNVATIASDFAAGRLLAQGDFDGDGLDDRVEAVAGSVSVHRTPPAAGVVHAGSGWTLPEGDGIPRAAAATDLDGDCDVDLLVAQEGRLRFIVNTGSSGPRMLHLRLGGVRHSNGRQFGWTNDRGVGVRVDAITGRRRVRRWMGLGFSGAARPPSDVVSLGLGPEAKADLISLRWTEGVLQAEPDVAACPAGGARIEQVQRKAASCPVIFTWDGEKFAYVADCMGGGGLGFMVAPGTYGPPDPTERVYLPGALMKPRDGFYEVRLVEPLEETCYADRLALVAVDHPAGTTVRPDERFGGVGPAPADRVYVHADTERVFPVSVRDHSGADRTEALRHVDRIYADGFRIHRDLLGFTEEPHWVEFDFGDRIPARADGERLVLFLDGWIEYGYSRTFYAAAGAGVTPMPPLLEVPDGAGGWKVAIPDIGYPAGTPRTMTFDVTAVLGPDTPRFRIRSNLEIFWDRVYLAPDRGEGSLVRTTLGPADATLRHVGFPREVSPDGRLPKQHDYALMDDGVPGFKSLEGSYTRFGDVRELLLEADDRSVIFRNGEEIALRFRASDLPLLREGYVRDFLLVTDGWCKDMDPYTATPQTVSPLPFRGMSNYPPREGEAFPETEATREWRRVWNTRRIGRGR
jgi:Tfp pilus assembly protein PilF